MTGVGETSENIKLTKGYKKKLERLSEMQRRILRGNLQKKSGRIIQSHSIAI